MSLLHHCERKAKYVLFDQAQSPPSQAQQFGSLIHKALERYYSMAPELHTDEVLVELWAQETSEYVDAENGLHTKAIGKKVLSNYAKVYANDPWVAVRDYSGLPFAETQFEFELEDCDDLAVFLFGTIDLLVKNTQTGEYAVMDHKTGRSLGTEFMNRWKPNHQASAYILAAQQHYKLPVNKMIINGLQIAKTVQQAARVETYRDAAELEEFKTLALHYAYKLERLAQGDLAIPADSITCSSFGGCSFLNVCALTPALRETALANMKNNESVEGEL